MTHLQIIEMLYAAGFVDGWTLSDTTLILWEHDQDPPTPLVRPDETPSSI